MIEGSGSRAGSGSGSIPLSSGSGSGRPKNMRIRWIRIRIRIRNTEDKSKQNSRYEADHHAKPTTKTENVPAPSKARIWAVFRILGSVQWITDRIFFGSGRQKMSLFPRIFWHYSYCGYIFISFQRQNVIEKSWFIFMICLLTEEPDPDLYK